MEEEFEKWFRHHKAIFPLANKAPLEIAFAAGYKLGHVSGKNFAAEAMTKHRDIVAQK